MLHFVFKVTSDGGMEVLSSSSGGLRQILIVRCESIFFSHVVVLLVSHTFFFILIEKIPNFTLTF